MQNEGVRLRPLQRNDSPLLYEWITCRELVIQNSSFYPVSEVDHEGWIESMLAKRDDLVIFVIEEQVSKQAIGTCQLHKINMRHRNAELQIRIGNTQFLNRGLGSQAVTLLCNFGYADLNLHRIYLHVFANNLRAIKAYEKCGFSHEGLLKDAAFIDGAWANIVTMGKINKYE